MDVVNDIFAPIFEGAGETPFDAGQFVLGGFVFNQQQRDYGDYEDSAEGGAGAVLGATMRIHEMAASTIFRSSMAPLHWDYGKGQVTD
jgi:hypothetical protein